MTYLSVLVRTEWYVGLSKTYHTVLRMCATSGVRTAAGRRPTQLKLSNGTVITLTQSRYPTWILPPLMHRIINSIDRIVPQPTGLWNDAAKYCNRSLTVCCHLQSSQLAARYSTALYRLCCSYLLASSRFSECDIM